MSKKKKIFILVSMVLLLVVTGYLNIALNKSSGELQTSNTTANFFTSCRADKLATRNYQLEIYQNMFDTATTAEDKALAKEQLDLIAAKMETELILESKIVSSGYEDAIVTKSDDVLYVYVKSPDGLNADQVASILSILVGQTKMLATNIKITPVA